VISGGNHSQDNKTSYYLFYCLNYVLRNWGINDGRSVQIVAESLNDIILKKWPGTRTPELKEQFVQFFRLQMRMDKSLSGVERSIPELEGLYKYVLGADPVDTNVIYFKSCNT
jgi:hypothetical protein